MSKDLCDEEPGHLPYLAGEKWRNRLEANDRRIEELERLVDVLDSKIKSIQKPSWFSFVMTVAPILLVAVLLLAQLQKGEIHL